MSPFALEVAGLIRGLYETTLPTAHDKIDSLREHVAATLIASNMCSYEEFDDEARRVTPEAAARFANPALSPDYGLNHAFHQVRQFHQDFGHPCPDSPVMQSGERVERRANWIKEEAEELWEAETLIDQVDAYIDIIYFALGGLVELGVVPQGMFDAVQAANMGKKFPDGTIKRDELGKILKPAGWQAPEPQMLKHLEEQHILKPLASRADVCNTTSTQLTDRAFMYGDVGLADFD